MKKSTLITSIAMIVVVVVALSTATYAWFSADSKTTAETTISTQASSGIILYGGAYTTGSTVAFSSTNPLDFTMPEGIYSPTGALTNAFAEDAGIFSYSRENFYNAKYRGGSINGADSQPANNVINPVFIRIINNTGNDKKIVLTIYVEVAAGSGDNVYKAAAGFVTSIKTSAGNTYTTGYNVGTVDNSTTGTGVGYYEAHKGTAIARTDTKGTEGTNELGDEVYFPEVVSTTSAIASQGFANVTGSDAEDVGLTAGAKYRSIVIDLGTVADKEALNIAFYAWLDGWALNDEAAGVEGMKIVYSFGADDAV